MRPFGRAAARAVGPNDRRRGAHRDLWIARPAIVPRRRVEVDVGYSMGDLGKFCTACIEATVPDRFTSGAWNLVSLLVCRKLL